MITAETVKTETRASRATSYTLADLEGFLRLPFSEDDIAYVQFLKSTVQQEDKSISQFTSVLYGHGSLFSRRFIDSIDDDYIPMPLDTIRFHSTVILYG